MQGVKLPDGWSFVCLCSVLGLVAYRWGGRIRKGVENSKLDSKVVGIVGGGWIKCFERYQIFIPKHSI